MFITLQCHPAACSSRALPIIDDITHILSSITAAGRLELKQTRTEHRMMYNGMQLPLLLQSPPGGAIDMARLWHSHN